MRKVLAFDMDNTLTAAKTPMSAEIAGVLAELLGKYEIAVISGAKYEQFLAQIVDPLRAVGATDAQLRQLHLFVTQGTRYYRFKDGDWELVYKYDLNDEQVKRMSEAVEKAARELGYWVELNNGDEVIENRLAQVTYSALGQKAGLDEKEAWDSDHKKRNAIAALARKYDPEFYYEVAGTTSINITLPGTNKTFGMKHLLEELGVTMQEVLYFGDMTQQGGNDYPVVEMGFDTITVRDWRDTVLVLRGILGVS